MVLKNRTVVIFLIAVMVSAVFSASAQQDHPLMSSGDLQFYFDKAVFAGTDEKSYVELYLMFFADQIDFSKGNNVELNINVVISRSLKNIAEKNWIVEVNYAEDNGDMKSKVFYDQINEYLLPGRYTIEINVKDAGSGRAGKISGEMVVKDMSSEKTCISEIQFVSSVIDQPDKTEVWKGKKSVITNPSRRYGILNPILYFYYEIYNIQPDYNSRLSVSYLIKSMTGGGEKKFPSVELDKENPVIGVTHGLNVGNLSSGIYSLNITVIDKATDRSFAVSRDFEIIQSDYSDRMPVIGKEESEIFGKILSIIGSESQLRNYNRLNSAGKATFIVEFWKSVDPSPGTSENEYLQAVQQRFIYANKNFGWGKIEGWRSERGRVLIKYGNPDEIERHHLEADSYPYEIWIYNKERRYLFVFGDLDNNGKYVLLHSNREGEVFNERWKEYLQKM